MMIGNHIASRRTDHNEGRIHDTHGYRWPYVPERDCAPRIHVQVVEHHRSATGIHDQLRNHSQPVEKFMVCNGMVRLETSDPARWSLIAAGLEG